MNNIVVTGATSFIGLELLKVLLSSERNHVFAVVRPNSPNKRKIKPHANLTVLEIPLEDLDKLPAQVSESIDAFYHLAWEGTRGSARDNQLLQENNYQFSMQAIKVAYEVGCKCFVGIGSQAEYGTCIGKIKEDYKAVPLTEYGKAKLRTCEDGKKFADSHGVKFIWVRIFSVYGKGDFEGTLVISAIRKMLKSEKIALTACTQRWDYLHVSDAANALWLLSSAPSGIYNIASGTNRPLKYFIHEMFKLTNSHSELEFGAISGNTEGNVGFEPVVDKLITMTGWVPKISFSEGITEIIEEMKREML